MNRDYETRDKIIFGEYKPENYFGGCRRFTCTIDTLQELLKNDFLDENECQNDSPSTRDFLDIFADESLDVRFNCYAISPDRGDYRITIEGVDVEITEDDYDNFINIIESLRYADEFSIDHVDSAYVIHAWWD